MPFRAPLSLRALVLIGSGLLSVCGIVAVAALVMTTTYLHRASVTISEAVNSVVSAEELQKLLLEYSRDRMALAIGHDVITQEAVDETEKRIRHGYTRIEMHASTADEQAMVVDVQRLIDAYIGTRPREVKDLNPEEVFADSKRYLDPARAKIRDLVMLNQRQAADAQAMIDTQDRLAYRVGIVISAALVLIILAVLYGLRVHLYKPLMVLRRAMQVFGQGNVEARAHAGGPIEIREIARVFNDLADGLKLSRENQYRFLAAVAHDLRNPLNALRMAFELVCQGPPADGALKEEVEAIAKRQIDQLDQMVGDLLDRSRLEAGKFSLRFEKRDLRLDVEQAAALHRQVSPSHRIVCATRDTPVRLEYDSLRLSQVLNNLIGNAIKYSPSGGTVTIAMKELPTEVQIEVKDEGIGIAPDDLGHIFEPFRRSRLTRETIPGVGLGLAVAKRLVEAHGGRLEVESKEGFGSIFRVCLPRPEADTQPSGSIVAYISQTATGFVSRGGRTNASEIPIEQS